MYHLWGGFSIDTIPLWPPPPDPPASGRSPGRPASSDRPAPSSILIAKGWAEMIRKVHEVDPMICPRLGGRMRVVAFLTEHAVVDRIIRHLELMFVAEKPPPSRVFEQVALMAADESVEYFQDFMITESGSPSLLRRCGRFFCPHVPSSTAFRGSA